MTHTDYDSLGRARFVTQNWQHSGGDEGWVTTEKQYDLNGNVTAVVLHNRVDANGDGDTSDTGESRPQTTSYGFDEFDRQTSETLPAVSGAGTGLTTTTYSRAGEALTITDPMDHVVVNTYDRAGRVSQTQFNFGGSTEELRQSTYDHNGNLTERTDGLNGQSHTIYEFDALNRQTSETRHNGTEIAGGTADYIVTSKYDADGNRTLVVYPDTGRTLRSTYDAANRMVQVDDGTFANNVFAQGAIASTGFSYDPAGNRVEETSAYGVVTTNNFDAMNRVYQITSRQGGSGPKLYEIDYGYDLAGERVNATEFIDGVGTRNLVWSYDHLYRLTGESWTGDAATLPQARSYAYDPAGNRLSSTIDDGTSTIATISTYDDRNRLSNGSGGYATVQTTTLDADDSTTRIVHTSDSYDDNGNLIEKDLHTTQGDFSGDTAASWTYQYDLSNRLTHAANESGSSSFDAYYDARTRRVAKTEYNSTSGTTKTTFFRYDGGTNFQELWANPANFNHVDVMKELVRAGGLGGGIGSVLYSDETMAPNAAGPWEGFIYNATGDSTVLTDSSGVATQKNLYGAFGDTVITEGDSDNNRLRNTKERDASTGLDDDGFRYYDSSTGRYIQRDPSGYSDGLNVYLSDHDDPVNKVDPQGLNAFTSWVSNAAGAVAEKAREAGAAAEGFGSEAWSQTKKVGSALASVPRGIKNGISNAAMTVAMDAGNSLGLVSDETEAENSPLVHYFAGHMEAGTIPVGHELKDLGSGLIHGDPDSYRSLGVVALTTAAGMKLGGAMGRGGRLTGGAAGGTDEAMGNVPTGGGINPGGTVTLEHGSTLDRVTSINLNGPNENFVEPGGQPGDTAGGFSTSRPGGTNLTGTAEQAALSKAAQAAGNAAKGIGTGEGGPAILRMQVPQSIVNLSEQIGGEVRFSIGKGLEELKTTWKSITREIKKL